MAFDPDAYLAKVKGESTPSKEFDPDAYLAKKQSSVQEKPRLTSQEQQDIATNSLKEDVTDTMYGVSEGALLGGAGEVGGGLQAILDLGQRGLNKIGLASPSPSQVGEQLKSQGFTGDLGPASTSDIYRQGEKETQQRFDAAEARSPYLYTAGQLAGGVATGSSIAGGLGLGAEALASSKAGQLAARYSPEMIKNASAYLAAARNAGDAASLSQKAARIGASAGKMALLGIPEGALAGGLMSKNNLIGEENPEKLDKFGSDVISGAGTGSLFGAGISLASDLGPMAAKAASDKIGDMLNNRVNKNASMSITRKSYQEGRDLGKNYSDLDHQLYGEPGKFQNLNNQENRAATDIVDRIMEADKMLGTKMGESLETATNSGVKINITDDLGKLTEGLTDFSQKNPDLFDDPKVARLFNKIYPGSTELTPIEAKGAIAEIDNLYNILKKSTVPRETKLAETALRIRGMLRDELEKQIPQYKNASKRFQEFRQNFVAPFENGNTPIKYKEEFGPLSDRAAKLHSKVRDVILESARADGKSTAGSVRANLSENIANVNKNEAQRIADGIVEPGQDIFSAMRFKKPSDFADQIKEEALSSAAMRQARSQNLTETGAEITSRGLTDIASKGRAMIPTTANFAGRVVGSTKGFGKKLYSLGPQQMNALAQDLISSKSSTQMGQALQDAIVKSDTAKMNAILFSIMQNPNLRIHISSVLDQDSTDSQSEQ